MQAGIQLKNHLYSKDYEIRCQHQRRWLMFPEDMKKPIKANVSRLNSVLHSTFSNNDCGESLSA